MVNSKITLSAQQHKSGIDHEESPLCCMATSRIAT